MSDVPDILLSTEQILIHLIFVIILYGKDCCYLSLSDEKTEAQRR